MTGVLIVTHGNLGVEMLNTARLIIGETDNAHAISLNYEDDIKKLKEQVMKKIKEIDSGGGVIVFTDMFGGSPNTAVAANLKEMDFTGIAGVNLPMLLECLICRETMDAHEIIEHIKDTGKDSIKVLNDLL